MLVAEPPGYLTRIWFAWACFFRVLLDPGFAARAWAVRASWPEPTDVEPPPAAALRSEPPPAVDFTGGESTSKIRPARPGSASGSSSGISPEPGEFEKELAEARAEASKQGRGDGALQLLALLQAEGRLVDFVQQDITSFADADVATAARVIHEGCRKALRDRIVIEPIRSESEGVTLTIDKGFDAHALKLTGTLSDKSASFRGTLRHKGWRATRLSLPEPTRGHDAHVLCPAEVEL